jgi:hypothetical protein
MHKNIFISLFIFFYSPIIGQNKSSNNHKNVAFIEFGGNGFLNSINYDRLLNPKDIMNHISSRIGVGYYKSYKDSTYIKTIPFEINYWRGKLNSHLEFGIGYTPSFGQRTFRKNNIVYANKSFDYNILIRVGFRYQEKDGRKFFRCGITPIIYRDYFNKGKFKIAPWGAIAVGIAF